MPKLNKKFSQLTEKEQRLFLLEWEAQVKAKEALLAKTIYHLEAGIGNEAELLETLYNEI